MSAIAYLIAHEWGEHGDCSSCGENFHHSKRCGYARVLRKHGGKKELKRQAKQTADYLERLKPRPPGTTALLDIRKANDWLKLHYSPDKIEKLVQ
jgi:hypothetical protein